VSRAAVLVAAASGWSFENSWSRGKDEQFILFPETQIGNSFPMLEMGGVRLCVGHSGFGSGL
jgi:hypothetical protein